MKTNKVKLFCLCLVISLALGFSACASKNIVKTLTPVTVQLQWTHQTEFAGFYAADKNGYYAEEGLSVIFLPGGSTIDNLATVSGNQAQFGTASADQLIAARASGQALRAISTVYRRSPSIFFTLADSGISRPQDFAGKTIRVPSNIVPTLHAMTARVGVTPGQYTEVNLPSDVNMFLTGDVPIWGGYINGIVVDNEQAGTKLNIIYPDDYGIHFYGDSIITTDNMISSNPDLVLKFLRATLKGWTWAIENADKTGALVQQYAPENDPTIEIAKMTASIPLINTGEDHIGWMKPEIWAGMEQTLKEQGLLTASLDITQVYTMQFLEEIYK